MKMVLKFYHHNYKFYGSRYVNNKIDLTKFAFHLKMLNGDIAKLIIKSQIDKNNDMMRILHKKDFSSCDA